MSEEVILKDHEVVKYLHLWAQRSGWTVDEQSFNLGRMSVALMLESQSRILEEFGTSLSMILNQELIASALRDLLRSLEIDDDVLDVYDCVVTMKAADVPKYVPSDAPSESLSADESASQPSARHQVEPHMRLRFLRDRARSAGAFEQVLIAEQIRSIEEGEAELREGYRSRE